jgi:hypothetical protein
MNPAYMNLNKIYAVPSSALCARRAFFAAFAAAALAFFASAFAA